MTDPFDPVRRKIRWGKQHVQTAYGIAKPFVERKPYRTVVKPYGHGGVKMIVESVEPFPADFGLAIGDAVQNFRSALDHAMYIIARPATDEEKADVQFPIYSTGKFFRKNAKRRIANSPREVLAVLESLQPYHRRKWPETRCLWQLRQISDWDKHRSLLTSIGEFVNSSVSTNSITGNVTVLEQEAFTGILKPGAVLARVQTAIPERGAEMCVEAKSTKRPVFDIGMPKEVQKLPVLETVNGAGHFIETQVLPRLLPFV